MTLSSAVEGGFYGIRSLTGNLGLPQTQGRKIQIKIQMLHVYLESR